MVEWKVNGTIFCCLNFIYGVHLLELVYWVRISSMDIAKFVIHSSGTDGTKMITRAEIQFHICLERFPSGLSTIVIIKKGGYLTSYGDYNKCAVWFNQVCEDIITKL